MGQINILNDAGTAKLSLQFTGTTNKSLNSELLSSITSDVQTQLDSKVSKSGSTMTGDLILDNGTADGSQIVLKSAGNSDWNIDNYNGSIRFYNGSTVRAQIDSVGRVQMPYQPAFFAVKQGGSVNASTGAGIVSFSNTYHDRSNSWNGSRFTAPVAGTYQIIFEQMYHHEGGDITFQIFKNGAAVSYNNPYGRDSQGYAEQWSTSSVHWLGNLNVGDYIEFSWASGGVATTTLYGSGLYTKALGFYLG